MPIRTLTVRDGAEGMRNENKGTSSLTTGARLTRRQPRASHLYNFARDRCWCVGKRAPAPGTAEGSGTLVFGVTLLR